MQINNDERNDFFELIIQKGNYSVISRGKVHVSAEFDFFFNYIKA